MKTRIGCSERKLFCFILVFFLSLLNYEYVGSLSFDTRFPNDVFLWLESVNVPWTRTTIPPTWRTNFLPYPHCSSELINLSDGVTEKIILHLIPTPKSLDESLPCNTKKFLTDSLLQIKYNNIDNENSTNALPPKIVHLHEDVWTAKTSIVKSRLLAHLGRSQKRIFARKTISKRINATFAMEFLEEHHLWGATRAKHYYGLFLPDDNQGHGSMVAVATFSSRRKIRRQNNVHKSHELLRFCAQRDATVVGGISKLIKMFIDEQSPDDIVTVVDRDWGDGSGWHTTGFETVHTMAPIVMVVNPNEPGIRRHLVGAGIQSDSSSNGRVGLSLELLELLDKSSSREECLDILSKNSFYPVYDSGVERLLNVIKKSSKEHTAEQLWQKSQPCYASSYYSENSGISFLLQHAEHSQVDTSKICMTL